MEGRLASDPADPPPAEDQELPRVLVVAAVAPVIAWIVLMAAVAGFAALVGLVQHAEEAVGRFAALKGFGVGSFAVALLVSVAWVAVAERRGRKS
jgi:hypothetical protein